MKTGFRIFGMALLGLLVNSCSGGAGSGGQSSFPFNTPTRYFQIVPQVAVDVYYEPGAEPYFGNNNAARPLWNVLRDNLTAIFQYRSSPPSLSVPTQLSEMTAMPLQGKTNWLATELLALDSAVRTQSSDASTSRISVYFVKGYYNNGGGSQTGVIGVSLSGTPIIVIFKDVVEGSSGVLLVKKFVEQATLVHEVGHALGFVNNGVPMATAHQDSVHGAHTTDSDCVMYYLNEGASDLIQFFQSYMASSTLVMWGPNVLADAQAFSR